MKNDAQRASADDAALLTAFYRLAEASRPGSNSPPA